MGDEVDAGEVGLELLRREVGEQDAAHRGAVGGKAGADVQVDGHDAGGDLGAGDVDDLFAVKGGDGEGFAVGLADMRSMMGWAAVERVEEVV